MKNYFGTTYFNYKMSRVCFINKTQTLIILIKQIINYNIYKIKYKTLTKNNLSSRES